MKKGFTLIEILVVATIIVLLAGIGIGSYSTFMKGARDAKRKADIESLRGALEIYRSNNNGSYPDSGSLSFGSCTPGALSDSAGNIYIKPIPNDPKCAAGMKYSYSVDNSISSYTLAAAQESSAVGTSYYATPYGSQ